MTGPGRLGSDGTLAWLGHVPGHWKSCKFSREVCIVEGQVAPDVAPYNSMVLIAPNHVEPGTGRVLSTETASEQGAESGKYLVRAEEVIYSKIRPALAKVAIASADCLCSADMYPLRVRDRLLNRYLYWLLLSPQFTAWSVLEADRVAMPKINRDTLSALRIPMPPLEEQHAIADYLDRETARLDALVAAKERVLGLLAEKRRALISRAVTRGIDPRTRFRDSGILWLGEIPAHWRVLRAGLAGSILMGRQRAPAYETGSHMMPYLRVANVLDGVIDYGDVLEMNFEQEEQDVFGLLPGDVLLNEGQSRELVGRSAIYRGTAKRYCFQNTLIRFRPHPDLHPEYAQAQFASWLETGAFQLFCRQSTNIAHLGADRLAQMPMVLPPPNEQRAIVAHIARETARLDAVRIATERSITLLHERRSALIAAAVTGRIAIPALSPSAHPAREVESAP